MFKGLRLGLLQAVTATAAAGFLLSAPLHAQISFNSDGVPGVNLLNPTSLDFGPDDRLYVSQQGGEIKAFTLTRNGPADYTVDVTETINLIRANVQNHNDDGTQCTGGLCTDRQVTGILLAGTASNPVLYVASSDPRIAVGTDLGLDTNSGVISRLTCVGGISAGICQAWDHVDIVRGLPRSEENHATNGMDLDETNNLLYVMSGGNANKGAPSNNFSGTPEYYLSAAMLVVDLAAIEQIENDNGGPFVDPRNGAQFVYDLVTLDDPDRVNIDNTDIALFPYDVDHPYYNLTIDLGDPFGGNNSLNQAIPVPGGPVQIHSPGYRNAFDVVFTESGRIYTWDNGPNDPWGGLPLIFASDGTPKGTGPFLEGAGDYCTNGFNETGSSGHGDALHDATDPGYYGGHPSPVRAFPSRETVVNYLESSPNNWVLNGDALTLHELLPDFSPALQITDFPDRPGECEYLADSPAKVLEVVSSSTNGLTEYTASNFAAEMQGDLLAASFNGNIYRCKPDGPSSLVDLPGSTAGLGAGTGDCEVLFSGFGSQPLDVTSLGDDAPFPGTVWAAVYGPDTIYVFEPDDILICDPSDPAGDGDNDGFTNGDENDSGTDPCSGGSRPDDNDGDFVSDLNDGDDDADGIADVSDPFALDAANGLNTSIPVNYPFFNNDPSTGLFGLGFTGLMLDAGGTETWQDLFDPALLAAGGTAGLMTVEAVTTGDAFSGGGQPNDQENAFLFGIDADSTTQPFVIHSRVLPPFFGIDGAPGSPTAPDPFQSFGIFLGTGDMDNYLKLVVSSGAATGNIQVGIEENGTFSATNYGDASLPGAVIEAPAVDLYLLVDPQNNQVQARISLDEGVTIADLGLPEAIPAAWLSPSDDQGLAVGLISTANGADSFGATWDFMNVEFAEVTAPGAWTLIDDQFGEVRHENAFVQAGDKFYVMGGRESDAVRIYDPLAGTWSTGAESPIKLHHFQAVEVDGLIYVLGAMTGECCTEPSAPNVYIYDPLADLWITGPAMPAGRERGGAGAAVYNGQIYLVSGNTNGHTGPVSAAVDRFDPATGEFTALADIPNPRDHFFVTVANDRLYVVGGRTTGSPDLFSGTIPEVDVFDLGTDSWSTLPAQSNLPTPRAAAPTGLLGNEIIIAGGESGTRSDAHPETEALNLNTGSWRTLTDMLTPRHATQAIVSNGGFYLAAGSPLQGGPAGIDLDLEALYLFGETAPDGTPIAASSLNAPATFDFGEIQLASNANQALLLSNSGGSQGIVIQSIVIAGNGAFELQTPFTSPLVIAPGDDLQIGLSFSPVAPGADSDTLIITHSGDQVLNVPLAGEGVEEPVPLIRVNVGGPELPATDAGPAWSADSNNAAGQSPFLANDTNLSGHGNPTSRTSDVPTYVPDALFATERWDAAGGTDMVWNFPVTPGDSYLVRLYLMNGFDGTAAAGDRVFDIDIEGQAFPALQDIDLSGTWGDQVAAAYEATIVAGDGTLTVTFLAQVENPLANGIEILRIGETTALNLPPQIEPIADQSSVEGEDIDLAVIAVDTDGPANLVFDATGLPPGLGVLDPTNGHLGGVIDAGAAANSPYAVTVSVSDGEDTSELLFNWVVEEVSGAASVLHRINVGGPALVASDAPAADWSVDNAATPSALRVEGGTGLFEGTASQAHPGPVITTDPSIPPSTPAALFDTERFDTAAAPEMSWALPVPNGAVIEVRLYFAELFSGITAANQRVFSVQAEGLIPAAFTDIDQFAQAGAKGAFMRSATLTMADDTLDLSFITGLQSTALKGIEVIQLDVGGNAPPNVTNPGDQANNEADVVNLPIIASDPDSGSLSYSAINLPPDLVIDPLTGVISGTVTKGNDGAFLESGGLLVIEMESADTIPANWALETDPVDATGGEYLRYAAANQLNNPGVATITYPIEIQTPGTYRFVWRNLISEGTETTENNDSFLRINGDAFYGQQGASSIVCPKGFDPLLNDCTGDEPEGSGGNGWFKVYRSNSPANAWSWSTNTSDNDAHQIFARFDAPGIYTIEVSGRSLDHAIDRMVLFSTGSEANATNESLPESERGGAGAADGSPYATEVTVTDGIEPVVVAFEWVVSPEGFVNEPRAQLSITPSGGLTASTFSAGSISIENISTGTQQIQSVTIDLSTGIFQDMVWDPQGLAGDSAGKGLEPDSGVAETGYLAPADNTGSPPFSQPHNGLLDASDGYDVVTLNFTDFDPGEIFTFSVDIDPTSIRDAQGSGEAGAVSGLELSGATVEVAFDDASVLVSETFYIAGSAGGATAAATPAVIATPVLSVPGATLAPTTLSPDHSGAVIPAGEPAQTLEISGPPGAIVRLLQIEGALQADFGYELEAFEANEALAVTEFTAVIGPGGTVEIPVTLTRSDLIDGGFNYFSAVIEQDGITGPSSNFLVLELDSGLPNVAPTAVDDFGSVAFGGAVDINLLANDFDSDGTLDVQSIVIVDQPLGGTLLPGGLGAFSYTHDGVSDADDSFTYTVADNDGATSNLATVSISVLVDLPDDVDDDGIDNITDDDDDNDGFLDSYDPFALDADNGTTTDLPVTLQLFSDQPGTGLFGLGFTGLMSNGDITAAIPVEGDDYLDLYDVAKVVIDDNPASGGVLTLVDVEPGDAFQTSNSQTHAFQLGLNVDSNSQPFVVHSRILEEWFNGLTATDFQSFGMFIGTGDQDNYLKMVFDGADNSIELLLEDAGATSDQNTGADLLAATGLDLFLLVDPATDTAQAQLSIDGDPLVNIGTPVILPTGWLNPDDDFGLAMGIIATSFGSGAPFDANFDLLEAYFLATDDAFAVNEDDTAVSLDVLANDHVDPDLFITQVGATDSGGTAVLNDNGTIDPSDDVIDYTPAPDFFGTETFSYTVEDGNLLQATAVVVVTVTAVNDAPTVTLGLDQGALEDAGPQNLAAFATFAAGAGETQGNLGFDVSNDNNALFATQPAIDLAGNLSWESAADANGSATVTVFAQDDGGTANGGQDLSAAAEFVITVTPVNDAPSVTLGADPTVAEDAGAQTVATFASAFAPGGGADESGQSVLAYIVSNDNNALFSAQPAIGSDGTLSFTANAGASGQATVSVQVQDDGGTDDGGVDSSALQTFTISVTSINDAPSVVLAGDQAVDEDAGPQTVGGFASGFDAGAGEPDQSLLAYFVANDNNALFAAQPAIGTGGILTYTPADDANGVAVVSVQAQDDGGTVNGGIDTSAPQFFTITVNAVNDAPTVTLGAGPTIAEDAGAQTLANFASAFAPGGGADEAGQSALAFIVGNDNNALFSAQPAIGTDGALSFTAADNASGVAVVSVQVQDDGGTANGGVDSSAQQTFTITVDAVNDAPTVVLGASQNLLEDAGAQSLPNFASGFDAGAGETGQSLLAYLVSNDNNALFAAQPAIGTDGTLAYTLADDANGIATVSVQAQDDGGTDNGGVDISALQTFTITVAAVNDAPLFALAGDQQVNEDAGAQVVAAFAGGFAPGGGADESTQALSAYQVSNDNTGLFAAQPAIGNDGNLSYTPADNASGVALVSVQAQDDGGTADGGVDTSSPQTFTITVNAVNDAPAVVLAGNQSVNEDAGAQTVGGFASGFNAGAGESDQSLLAYLVSNDNNSLFTAQPAVGTDGTLSYTLADDANGIATVSVQAQDDGGTDNGGVDTSPVQTVTITVNAVNDAPTVDLAGDQQVAEDAGAQLVTDFASGFAPGGGPDEAGQLVAAYLVSNDNNDLFAAQPAISTDGTLGFTTADGANGQATVSVQVQDDGGTDNGGVDTSSLQTFTISVRSVNDAPTVVLAGDQTVNEDAGAQSAGGFASAFNPGTGEDGQVVLDYLVSSDNAALFAGQPDVANDGTLSFTPADDANGVAIVSVQVRDDGGTDEGGVDTSPVQTFTITVQAVNDAPGFLVGSDQTVELDAGAQLVPGFATGFTPGGGADEASQVVSDYLVDNDNASLFEVAPDISNDGSLAYTPAEGEFGTATVSVQVQDDGGTSGGGIDTSEVQTFTITVNPEMVAPTIEAVDTVAGTADGVLLPAEATASSITQLLVRFSEDVSTGGGADPANYRLFAAGFDGVFSSTACGAVAGDDLAISVDSVTWVEGNNTAALFINGGVDLPEDVYLLGACDTIEDAVGNALENDFSLSFSVTRTNGFANPNFDSGLEDWLPVDVSWSSDDADQHETSGSFRWEQLDGSAGTGIMSQCVVLDQSGAFSVAGLARISSLTGTAKVEIMSDAFSSEDCSGSPLGTQMLDALSGDTAGAWQAFKVDGSTPSGSLTALVSIITSNEPGDEASIDVDNVMIESQSLLFKDGFELGD